MYFYQPSSIAKHVTFSVFDDRNSTNGTIIIIFEKIIVIPCFPVYYSLFIFKKHKQSIFFIFHNSITYKQKSETKNNNNEISIKFLPKIEKEIFYVFFFYSGT